MSKLILENAEAPKGIRIEPTAVLYTFLKEVQREVRPQAGRKIPLADILTSFARMSIASVGSVSDAAIVLLNGSAAQASSSPSTIPLPQYVSTSTAPQNVQNIWDTAEQMLASGEPNTEAANKAQDERTALAHFKSRKRSVRLPARTFTAMKAMRGNILTITTTVLICSCPLTRISRRPGNWNRPAPFPLILNL